MQPPLSPPALAPGDSLGPYAVERQLGRGGMGAVWQARHTGTGRAVALKVITSRSGGVEVEERFRREARVLGRLQHPYIVDVSDFDVHRGQPYLVMELLGGRSLRAELAEKKRLTSKELVDIVEQVAAALDHAHARGVIHRDLKPENIQLVAAGDGRTVVRVLDFGIARLQSEDEPPNLSPEAVTEPGQAPLPEAAQWTADTTLTGHGSVLGTPPYMAPEQFLAQPVEEKTDVYALAALSWECLTGHVPRLGDARQLLLAHLERKAPALEDTSVPWALRELLRRAMDPDRAVRPSPLEFAGHLRAIVAGANGFYGAAQSNEFNDGLGLRSLVVVPPLAAIACAVVMTVDSYATRLPAIALLLAPWCAGGLLSVRYGRERSLLRAAWGPVLARARDVPIYLRPVWLILAGKFTISMLVAQLVLTVGCILIAALDDIDLGFRTAHPALPTIPLGFSAAIVFVGWAGTVTHLMLCQVRAAHLLVRAQRGEVVDVQPQRMLVFTATVLLVASSVAFMLLLLVARPMLHRAIWSGAVSTTRMLAQILPPSFAQAGDDFDPVLVAVTRGFDGSSLERALLARRDGLDETPALHAAVVSGNASAVAVLCPRSKDPGAQDAGGISPLSHALQLSDPVARRDVVRALLACQVPLDRPDVDGRTPRNRLLSDPSLADIVATP